MKLAFITAFTSRTLPTSVVAGSARASTRPRWQAIALHAALFALCSLLLIAAVQAGTGGTEFDGIWELLKGWAKGTLGKIAALFFLLYGVYSGATKGSVQAVAPGLGAALVLYYGPGVIDGVVTAVI